MSKRLAVPTALAAAIETAIPLAKVLGPADDVTASTRIDAGGRIVVPCGDPGKPMIDLSPVTYNYDHDIVLELIAPDEATLDAMLVAIGELIEADRTLGGACDYLDAVAPETEPLLTSIEGTGPALRTADLTITASYSTPHPLT